MAANDLGDKGKAEAGAVGLGGYERIKQMRHQIGRYARTVVMDAEFQRQRNLFPRPGNRQADTRPVGRRQHDLAVRLVGNRFRRVLDQVEEDLDQLVAVGIDGRQRRIVILVMRILRAKPALAMAFT